MNEEAANKLVDRIFALKDKPEVVKPDTVIELHEDPEEETELHYNATKEVLTMRVKGKETQMGLPLEFLDGLAHTLLGLYIKYHSTPEMLERLGAVVPESHKP